jgi:hypothetical protein
MWTPFQTHYFSENPVAPGIEPGPLDLQPRKEIHLLNVKGNEYADEDTK